jgi:hypothetical protein
MMFDLSCAIYMRALLRLSLHVEILITDSTRLFLRNLESPLMIPLLVLSRLLAAYVHVVLLLILIMNVLTHLLWSLLYLPCVQLLMSSMRASPMTRSLC